MFAAATANGGAALSKLLVGTTGTPGAFASINTLMTQYTQTSGLLASSQAQRASQVSRLTDQISSMQDRLAVQRASLQREFAAADAAMTALKNQSGALASFGTSSAKLTSPTSSGVIRRVDVVYGQRPFELSQHPGAVADAARARRHVV